MALQDSAAADGVAEARVQLVLRDSIGAIVQNRPISFVGSSDTSFVQPMATDAQGQATVVITSATPQTQTVSGCVKNGTNWLTLHRTATVAFYDPSKISANIDVAGAVYVPVSSTVAQMATATASMTQSSGSLELTVPLQFVASMASAQKFVPQISDANVVADGQQAAHVALRLLDAQSNAVAQQAVTVSAQAPAACEPANGLTDSFGHFLCGLKSVRAAPTASRALTQDLILASSVNFVAGPPALQNFVLLASPPQTDADGASSLGLTAVEADAWVNKVANVQVVFSGDATDQFSSVQQITAISCTAWSALRATRVGMRPIIATLPQYGLSANMLLSFASGPPATNGMTLTALPTATVADGIAVATFTATVRDAFGNPAANIPVAWTASGASKLPTSESGVTDGLSVFVGAFVSTRAQSKTVSVESGQALAQVQINFVAGDANLAHSSFVAPAQNIVADGIARDAFTVTLRDNFDNPVALAQVNFLMGRQANDALSPSQCMTATSGACSTTVLSSLSGIKTITASGAFGALVAQGNFVAANPDAYATRLSCVPDAIVVGGATDVLCTLRAVDGLNNAVSNLPVLWRADSPAVLFVSQQNTTFPDGTAQAHVASNTAQIVAIVATLLGQDYPCALTFVAGANDANKSWFVANPNQMVANSNALEKATLRIADGFGNLISQSVDWLLIVKSAGQRAAGRRVG